MEERTSPPLREPGGIIRTFSVSLVAVAAIAAGLLFARARHGDPAPEAPPPHSADGPDGDEPPVISLEELRRAGI